MGLWMQKPAVLQNSCIQVFVMKKHAPDEVLQGRNKSLLPLCVCKAYGDARHMDMSRYLQCVSARHMETSHCLQCVSARRTETSHYLQCVSARHTETRADGWCDACMP